MEISVEGKQYRINVSKLFELVSISDKSEKREQEITDGYDYNNGDGTMHPVSKMIREIKTKGNTNIDNIRYDFFKMLLVPVLQENGIVLDFGTSICFNTLIAEGVLIPIEINTN